MPYDRSNENAEFINFADQKLKICPYCGSNKPLWHEEGYNANWALGYQFEMGYKFRCYRCGGEIEFRCHTKSHFFNEKYRKVIMLNAGTGTMNRNLVGYVISYEDLKKLCGAKVQASGYCVKCGSPMKSGTIFCMSCGHKQKEAIPFKLDEKSCVHCGSAIKKSEKFCTICGGKQPSEYIVDEKPMFCDNCGHQVNKDDLYCSNCHAIQKRNQKEKMRFCIKCGNLVKEGTVFCTNCGQVQKQGI